MKNILIKQACIINKNSKHHQQIVDVLITSGSIAKINKNISEFPTDSIIISGTDLHTSVGWMDIRSNLNDPGNEHKEDIHSGAAAAQKGGFTAVACMGTTNPALHSKSQIEYIINKSKSLPVKIYPIGTVTNKAEGIDLAELYDMSLSGAIAFSDNKNPIANPELLQRAMQYANGFNKKLIQIPFDKKIANDGKVNEGIVSTALGLKGIPAIAEELMLQRDLMLAAHHQIPIHIGGVSTAASVEIIRQAKQKGIKVTCDVHAINLLLTDEVLDGFDTNYKILPPLRTQRDIDALIAGLKDGSIDVICTDHTPQDTESKVTEFDSAAFGMTGLETFFPVILKALNGALSITEIIEKIAINPRIIFDLQLPQLEENQSANLTIFSPSEKWTYETSKGASKSHNTPFNGVAFTGKAIATVYNE